MFNMDRWDVMLLAVGGYLAVVTLSRLLARHRDRLVVDLERQATAESRRQQTTQRTGPPHRQAEEQSQEKEQKAA